MSETNRTSSSVTTRRNGKPTAVQLAHDPMEVDFFGKTGRVKLVADLISNAQEQLLQFRAMMAINVHSQDDHIPIEGGEGEFTYGERISSLEKGISDLLDANEDIHDELIAAAVQARKVREES